MSRIFVAAALVLAPHTAVAAFERPPLGPEGEAMGGVLAVSSDGVFGNPAGGALPEGDSGAGLQLRASTARPFGLAELRESQVSLWRQGARLAVGVGARRFGSDEYAEREIRLTVAWAAWPSLSVGVAARALEAGGAFAPVRSFALDGAFHVRSDDRTEVGALVEALLGEVPGDPRAELRRTAFGVARGLGTRLTLRVELQRQGEGPLAAVVGAAWSPVRFLTLRAGAREEPSTLAGGFTVRRGALAVTGAASWASPLGRTLRVGLVSASGRESGVGGQERLKDRPPGTE